MLIVGAGGFAKELLQVCHERKITENLCFFDNITEGISDYLFGIFPILKTEQQVRNYFDNNEKEFALGLGNPIYRKNMVGLFESWGGVLSSIVSPKANIGYFKNNINPGATILANANITCEINIGKGLLMYSNSIITHNCTIGDYVELSPGATILGNCVIGSETRIGANATILPGIKIGKNVIVGAGAVVTHDITDFSSVKGIPAK